MRSFFLAVLFFVFAAPSVSAQPFVQARGGQLRFGGKPYYFIGTNYWYGSLLAQGAGKPKGEARVRRELDFLKSQGVTNLRLLGGAEGSGLINGVLRVGPPLQPEQGVFDDAVLEGLDFILAEMGKRGMKAVLVLSNNWEWSGGFLQYDNWNGLLPDSILRRTLSWEEFRDYGSRFYTCAPCVAAYHRQVSHLLARRNSLNGKRYANDPTIMTWELANEPRPMRPEAAGAYARWCRETAASIKAQAPKQLVCLGHEGYIGTQDTALYEAVHRDPNVDYLTIHIWPKNWAWFRKDSMAFDAAAVLAKTAEYLAWHLQLARRVGKPLVLEEFGLPRDGQSFDPASTTHQRDAYYDTLLGQWRRSVASNGPLAGVSFWAFGGSARPHPGQTYWKPGDDYMGDPPMEEQGLNTVFDSDRSTWAVIRKYRLQGLPAPAHPGSPKPIR